MVRVVLVEMSNLPLPFIEVVLYSEAKSATPSTLRENFDLDGCW